MPALALLGCGGGPYGSVSQDLQKLVGVTTNDLMLCAGLPDRTAQGSGGLDFWSYERDNSGGGASLPLLQGSLIVSRSEVCRITFETADDRVRRVAVSRAGGADWLDNGACSMLVQNCLGMVRRGAIGPEAPVRAPGALQNGTNDPGQSP
jgi:hypothetical protein